MAALDYLDFDLEVEASATPGTYEVSVLSSPRGEASGQMTFPFNPDALENVILKLGRTRSGVRAIGSPTQKVAKDFGSALYDALFAGEVGTCFRRSLDEADAQGKGLRVRLRLGRAPQLADVPWEYLYPASLRQFLVLSTKTPVVRYLEQPRRVEPLTVTPPLQVLLVVASPTNLATLDVDAEVQRIRTALSGLEQSGQVTLTVVPHATLADLRRTMRRGDFHVLHFIGHGGFNDHTGEGMLAFEDDNHLAHLVSGSDLATMIHDRDKLRLVVLNACEGARQSPADPFGGVAQNLVGQGVPAVVAMQFEITDAAATIFGSEFYSAIADGYPIDAALAEARVAVFSDDNDVEWGTPVLYLRASDGRIFDVTGHGQPAPAPPQPPTEPAASAPEGGARVVPVVVPPWPSGSDAPAASYDPGHYVPSGPPEPSSGGSWTGGGAGGGAGGGSGDGGTGGGGASGGGGATGGASGGGTGGATGGSGGDAGGGDSGGTAPLYRPPPDAPPKRGPKWPILAAVAAVLAGVVFFAWPLVFPGGVPGVVESPTPSPPSTLLPTPTRTTTRPTTTRPTTTRSLPPVTQKTPLRAARLGTSFAIDGDTSDWQWQHEARTEFRVAGTSTARGSIYLMWDDRALYLLAQVTDRDVRGPDPNRPINAWKGDSIVFELGPDKRQLRPADLARGTDAYYVFGITDSRTPTVAILRPNDKRTSFDILDRNRNAIQAVMVRTNTGYLLEAAIPWSTTNLNGPRAGAVFAANVQVSERKTANFDNLGMMGTNEQRALVDLRGHPAYWQDLELLG